MYYVRFPKVGSVYWNIVQSFFPQPIKGKQFHLLAIEKGSRLCPKDHSPVHWQSIEVFFKSYKGVEGDWGWMNMPILETQHLVILVRCLLSFAVTWCLTIMMPSLQESSFSYKDKQCKKAGLMKPRRKTKGNAKTYLVGQKDNILQLHRECSIVKSWVRESKKRQ